jgi:predicted deacylase
MGPPLPPGSMAQDFVAQNFVAQNFVLLGSEVSPGTATRLSWTPEGGIDGLAAPTPVLAINGALPGPTLCLTAAVHGDELNGIEIVRRVMYDIDPRRLSGRIVGVPIVNLDGFRRGSRYLSDRRELNRHFPGSARGSLAARVAHSLLEEILSHCNLLVDIHTGSLGRTNLPQVRADMRRDEVVEFTKGFGHIVVLHSPGTSGMLRRTTQARGIHTATLEVGEAQRLQSKPVEAGVRAINRLLQRQRMYQRLFPLGSPEPVYYESTWERAPTGGILLNGVRLGAYVAAGQELGAVIDPITNARTPIPARVAGRVIGMAVNQVVMPGFAAYHLGIEASDEEPIETDDLAPAVEEEVVEEEAVEDQVTDDAAMDDAAAGGEPEPE